jgi:hypothetical protein
MRPWWNADSTTLKASRFLVSSLESLNGDEIRGQRRVDFDRIFQKRLLEIRHRRQRLVVDLDELRRVLGEIAAGGDDAGHRVAVEAHLVDGQGRHLHRVQPLDRRRHAQRRRPLREILPGVDGDYAFQLARCIRLYRLDLRVRMRRPYKAGVQRPRHFDVLDVAPVPGEEAEVFLARQRRADVPELRPPHRCPHLPLE